MMRSALKEGSVLGGVLLIAGSCIGAGMLALPVVTGVAGFVPSMFLFILAWVFMTTTGMLLLEANLAIGHHLSLISIAQKTLGSAGKILCWLLFIFLFYSLSVAYIAASGSILKSIAGDLFGIQLTTWFGSALFTIIFGIVLYIGTRPVDLLNRVLMVGLVIAYFVLVVLGSRYVNFSYLKEGHWPYAFASLPILVISFGFHNMIPTLAHYFKGDVKRLRITVLLGSAIPLVVYLLWEFVMLGIIPIQGREGFLHALDQGKVATAALRSVVGLSWISVFADAFALFAIVTSFLAQSLSLVDFLSDGLKIPKIKWGRAFLILLTLVPPFILAFLYPHIFIKALDIAGGFAAVILFGVMPALMVWVIRYRRHQVIPHLLPSGRIVLVAVLVFSMGVFLLEAAQELGWSLIPKSAEAAPIESGVTYD